MQQLVTWLWQGSMLVVGIWALLRLWRPSPATRFAIWWATLVAVLGLLVALSEVSRQASSASASLLRLTLPAVPASVLAIGIGAWLGLALLGLVHLVVSVSHLQRLKLACRPFPVARERRLSRWLAVRGEGRRARLCLSEDVRSASALGLGFSGIPIIAINPSLLLDVDDEELDHIALHEYAHIQRRDDWFHVWQLAVQALLVAHPAAAWIGRALRLEREAACDAWVMTRTHQTATYARCLTKIAAFELATPNDLIAAMGVVEQGDDLRRRIERLSATTSASESMGASPAASAFTGVGGFAAMPVAGVAMVLIAATVGLWRLPPLVAMDSSGPLDAVESVTIAAADATMSSAAAIAKALDPFKVADGIIVTPQPPAGVAAVRRVTSRPRAVSVAVGAAAKTSPSEAPPLPIASRTLEMASVPLVAPVPAGHGVELIANGASHSATDADAVGSRVTDEEMVTATADSGIADASAKSSRTWQRAAAGVGATVGQGAATVGVSVSQGAKRVGTATGGFVTRVASSIGKMWP